MWMTPTEAGEKVRLCFCFSVFLSRWCGQKSYLHLSLRRGGGLMFVWARAWAFSHVDGLSAWFEAPEICQGDKLPAPRGEQQQIGLLKQFSWTGGLLSACQQPDYSIQLFCCSQSAQRAPAAGPHGYLSIPDTGINTAAPQRRRTEGYRKCNLV